MLGRKPGCNMLAMDIGRQGRKRHDEGHRVSEHALGDIGQPMRVFEVEPPGIVLDDVGNRRQPPSEPTPSGDGIGLPELSLGKPSVTVSLYFSWSWYIASSVEIVPSRSMTICFATPE